MCFMAEHQHYEPFLNNLAYMILDLYNSLVGETGKVAVHL